MADKAQEPVLRRKVEARRAAAGAPEMSPAKALRMALAKAGDAVLRAPVTLSDLTTASLRAEEVAGAVTDPALILRLEAADGAVGLAILCPQTVSAVIEAQTLGRIASGAAPDRRATATDARLSRRFVEAALAVFADLAAGCAGLPALDGYRVAGRLDTPRVAAMALEDAGHAHLTATVDFANGAKSGTLGLVLPSDRRAAPETAADGGGGPWSAALERAVMSSPARLEAVLRPVKLTLADVRRLEPGQVLPLGLASLGDVRLVAADGRRLATARLGRSGPMRAVRLRVGVAAQTAGSAPEMAGLDIARGPQPAPAVAAGPAPVPDLPGPEPLPDLPAAGANATLPVALDLDA